jgi:hypothetical protein
MHRQLRVRLTYANVMATVAAFAAIGGGAFAIGAVPDREGRIKACFVPKGKVKGDVRLLVSGSKCRKGEAKVTWNQRGRRGAQGERGPQGLRGVQGAAGSGRAYAVINPTGCTAAPGSCPLLKAKNVLGARRPQQGFYCVTTAPGISDTTDGHMAGVEWDLTAGVVGAASAMPFAVDIGGGAICSAAEFTVGTERSTTMTNLVNDVAFWFAVP